MEYFVAMDISVLLEALQDKKAIVKLPPKLAKVFVAIEREAQLNASLAAAIEKARGKA